MVNYNLSVKAHNSLLCTEKKEVQTSFFANMLNGE